MALPGGATWLEPIYDLIGHYILGADVIGADETYWRMLNAKSSTSRRWWAWTRARRDADSRTQSLGKQLSI